MPYPEMMIKPMREDLTRLGFEELRTPEAVDATVPDSKGTLDGSGEFNLRLCCGKSTAGNRAGTTESSEA